MNAPQAPFIFFNLPRPGLRLKAMRLAQQWLEARSLQMAAAMSARRASRGANAVDCLSTGLVTWASRFHQLRPEPRNLNARDEVIT